MMAEVLVVVEELVVVSRSLSGVEKSVVAAGELSPTDALKLNKEPWSVETIYASLHS